MESEYVRRKREESIAFLRSFTPSKYVADGAVVNWKYPTVLHKPEWDMNSGTKEEFAAYDYGCRTTIDAVLRVLDGKDSGCGVANEPWESVRRRLLGLVSTRSYLGYRLFNR